MDQLVNFHLEFFNNLKDHHEVLEQDTWSLNPIDMARKNIEENKNIIFMCLSINRNFISMDQEFTIMIPKIGDLFVGILDHPCIDNIKFILSNYTDQIIVDGQLFTYNQTKLWQITKLPIPLLVINDYQDVNLSVRITIKQLQKLQSNIKGYYGFIDKTSQRKLLDCSIYQIPLLNQNGNLKIISGIWTIKTN
ncbi:MAG: hypothetical protein ABIN35_00820 [candidate division WOR-3 bacterium]